MVDAEFVLRPSIANALIPLLLKSAFIGFFISLIFYLLLSLLRNFIPVFDDLKVFFLTSSLFLIILILPVFARLIRLANTTYSFRKDHLVCETKFFFVTRHSVPYSQITNIRSNISVWDRFCNAGDIFIHTSDSQQDLVLYYLKNPHKVESMIYHLLSKSPKNSH